MEEKRDLIEQTVRKCVSRLNSDIPEEQIEALVDSLVSMKDIKTVVDSLALKVDKFFGDEDSKEKLTECLDDLYRLSGEVYSSPEEIASQISENKSKNYTPRKYFC